jgi:hypothetical protein
MAPIGKSHREGGTLSSANRCEQASQAIRDVDLVVSVTSHGHPARHTGAGGYT